MWIVTHNRCWTEDRLARGVFIIPLVAFIINHLLEDCVFARDFWFGMLQKVGMQNLSSQLGETSFEGWRDRASKAVDGSARKSLNSIVILGAWTLAPKKSLSVRWSFTKSK
jgi:hypothetical protein